MSRSRWLAPIMSVIVLGLGCSGHRDATPSIAKVANVPDETQVAGIGIRPIIHAHGFAIGQLFPGGPADQAGLVEGDVVVEVDGDPTTRWTLNRAAKRLRGAVGTTVTLVAERGGQRFEVRLERRIIVVP